MEVVNQNFDLVFRLHEGERKSKDYRIRFLNRDEELLIQWDSKCISKLSQLPFPSSTYFNPTEGDLYGTVSPGGRRVLTFIGPLWSNSVSVLHQNNDYDDRRMGRQNGHRKCSPSLRTRLLLFLIPL